VQSSSVLKQDVFLMLAIKNYTSSVFIPLIFQLLIGGYSSVSQSFPTPVTNSASMPRTIPDTQSVQVSCASTTNTAGEIAVAYQIKNVSDETVYVLDGHRMPYLMRQDDRSLIIFHAVNLPDPNISYPFTEIPDTRAVYPGQVVTYQAWLTPFHLSDHYGYDPEPFKFHGLVTVQCQVGWGKTLLPERLGNIHILLEWQHIAKSQPIQVKFP
jgi:hypothetical protein